MRFGLHYVNFSDPTLTRHPKDSAKWYAGFAAKNHHFGRLDDELRTASSSSSSSAGSGGRGGGSQAAVNPSALAEPQEGVSRFKSTSEGKSWRQKWDEAVADTDGSTVFGSWGLAP